MTLRTTGATGMGELHPETGELRVVLPERVLITLIRCVAIGTVMIAAIGIVAVVWILCDSGSTGKVSGDGVFIDGSASRTKRDDPSPMVGVSSVRQDGKKYPAAKKPVTSGSAPLGASPGR